MFHFWPYDIDTCR